MLTLRYVPYSEIEDLGPARRVKKLIDLVKEDKIVILEGRLKETEEKDLIEITMEEINSKFKGIELSVIYPDSKNDAFFAKMKKGFMSILLGDRLGMTIIGPASVVKKIKRDPDKIELFTQEKRRRRKR